MAGVGGPESSNTFAKAAEFEYEFEDSFLHWVFSPLMTEKCVRIMLVDFDVFHVECLKGTISKALGYGIILGSLAVKIPQILKLLQNKSGAGISVVSVTMELLAITFNAAYSFIRRYAFSSWGEGAFLALQTSIIGALVLLFEKGAKTAAAYFLVYALFVSVLVSPAVPLDVSWFLNCLTIPFVLCGKAIQAHTNFSNGHTGQLSVVTMSLLFLGAIARIFTSAHETGDVMLVCTYCVSTFVNGVILFQIIWYWDRTKSALSRAKQD